MPRYAPEGNAAQVSKEQRRVPNRRQTPAHVRDNEDEKHDMVRRGTASVHLLSRAGWSIEAPVVPRTLDRTAPRRRNRVFAPGVALPPRVRRMPPVTTKERADKHYEAEILLSGFQEALRGVQNEQVIARRDGRQPGGDLG